MATSTGGDGGGIDMRLSSSHLLRRRRRRRELLAVLFFGTLAVSACLVVLAGEKRKEKQRSLGRERARTKERKNVSEEFRRDSRSPTFFFFSPRPPLSFPPASSSRRAASSSSSSRQPLPPPWAQPLVRVRVCDDSCPSARDGRCDDGRFLFPRETLSFRSSSGSPPSLEDSSSSSPTREVKCDLGTDCSDCGGEPWEAWLPQELARALPRPIAELRRGGGGGRSGGSDRGGAGERNDETVSSFSATSSPPPPPRPRFRVFATRTATDPPFVAVHADPELDVDVSAQLASLGTVERGLTQVWRARLKGACSSSSFSPPPLLLLSSLSSPSKSSPSKSSPLSSSSSSSASPPPPPPLVLDVGANFGYYSLFAAALGCRVVAWEPVPRFRGFFEAALLLNPGLARRVEVRGAAACARDSSSSPPPPVSSEEEPPPLGGVTLAVPERGVWGTASVGGANIDGELEKRRREEEEEEEETKTGGEEGGERSSSLSSSSSPPPLLVEARCERIDSAVEGIWSATRTPFGDRRVALMKLDVEGYEPEALSGAARLFDGAAADGAFSPKKKKFSPFSSSSSSPSRFGIISDVVLEYSPGVPERNGAWESLTAWPAMLHFLKAKGFVLANVPFGGGGGATAAAAVTAGEDLLRGDWEAPLPSFEEVTLENLAADASDAERLRERTLGCPLPRELFAERGGGGGEGEGKGGKGTADGGGGGSSFDSLSHPAAFSRCNAIPEQLHPHSFRATFGHNTNVWAAREGWVRAGEEGAEGEGGGRRRDSSSSLLRLGRPVGVFGPSDPLTSWLPTTRAGTGMGGRPCVDLPLEVRVAHRCPCGGVSGGAGEKEEEEKGEPDGGGAKSSEAAAALALVVEASCRAEEELVASLARRGLMPPLHGESEASVALLGGRR